MNILDLAEYGTPDEIANKLGYAISECTECGFY
jgi:hypothetical protein